MTSWLSLRVPRPVRVPVTVTTEAAAEMPRCPGGMVVSTGSCCPAGPAGRPGPGTRPAIRHRVMAVRMAGTTMCPKQVGPTGPGPTARPTAPGDAEDASAAEEADPIQFEEPRLWPQPSSRMPARRGGCRVRRTLARNWVESTVSAVASELPQVLDYIPHASSRLSNFVANNYGCECP